MPDAADVRILVGIPSAGRVPTMFAYSLAGMVARFAASKVPTLPELSLSMTIRVMESSNWITNREKLARMAITEDATHLMFLDDDMQFDPRVLEVLVGRRQPVVVTNYLIKTLPAADFVAVGLDGKRVATTEESTGLQAVSYSGFGVSLIRVDVLKAVPQPWFMPKFAAERDEYSTEDFPFFERVREAGFPVYLDQDASKMVGHIGSKTWEWGEVKNA